MTPTPCLDPAYKIAIFTDLDGTLIDRTTYSARITEQKVRDLIEQGVVIVFCSSKTWREQHALMQEMGVEVPAIVENGSGVFLPGDCALFSRDECLLLPNGARLRPLGTGAAAIRDAIQSISAELSMDLRPYSDLTLEETAILTGLNLKSASHARNRDFSETLTASLTQNQWNEVDRMLRQFGLRCQCGGRFHTVTDQRVNKGLAVRMVKRELVSRFQCQVIAAGIGDSANDADMLNATDFSYLVQEIHGDWHALESPDIVRIPEIGPKGWLRAVEELFIALPSPGGKP